MDHVFAHCCICLVHDLHTVSYPVPRDEGVLHPMRSLQCGVCECVCGSGGCEECERIVQLKGCVCVCVCAKHVNTSCDPATTVSPSLTPVVPQILVPWPSKPPVSDSFTVCKNTVSDQNQVVYYKAWERCYRHTAIAD